MTISVLDRTSTADQPTLGNLHDEAGKLSGVDCNSHWQQACVANKLRTGL